MLRNNQKIKVLHIIETLDIGGAECVLAEIVNNLPSHIIPVVCCFKHIGVIAARISPNVKIFSLNKKEGNDLRIPFRLARIMKREKIYAVHTHNWGVFCESVLAAIMARIPVIVHMAHGGILLHPHTFMGKVKKKARRVAESVAAIFCDEIISVSDDLKKKLNQELSIPLRKIKVIRNGIMISHADGFCKKKMINELRLNNENFVIGFIGRLVSVKNIPLLLNAMKSVCAKHHNVCLYIVGEGPEKKFLQTMVKEYNLTKNIQFLGARDDVKDILSVCDLFVLPSFSEGISVSLLEAMSMRVPAVATRVGGNIEVVEDGITGFLVDSDDVNELTKAVLWCVETPEESKKIGECAFQRVRSHFNMSKNIEMFSLMYTKGLLAQESSDETS